MPVVLCELGVVGVAVAGESNSMFVGGKGGGRQQSSGAGAGGVVDNVGVEDEQRGGE
jgi:hypothetical protein